MNDFWNARRILKELCDDGLRREVLVTFWREGDEHAQHRALAILAKSLHFRPQSLLKSPAEKKADLLATRLSAADLEETFEAALMVFHTTTRRPMLAAFLDEWKIPHQDGSIEVDDYTPPTPDSVDGAVRKLRESFPLRDVVVYLATAGLLMGSIPEWREATWPEVEKLRKEI